MNNRILGIDYGSKRIGLALTDPLQIISSPYEVWENKGQSNFCEKLSKLIEEKKINTIVIGLPKNMNGSTGFQAEEVKLFFNNLIKEFKDLNFVYVDERLSSVKAGEILRERGIKNEKQKGIKDAYAAAVILKEYLEYRS